MRIISDSRLREASAKYPNAQASVRAWIKVTKAANWQSLEEARKTFPSADLVGKLTVFNIAGNHYRLITWIDYQKHRVYIRYFLTHAEYDKGRWKDDSWNQ
ncbi:MAG: type II toxin-antitoxin system HigB family toxin [Acaryochloris sp. RU_4_1]|nr:type II toxin-antitoxin system HigB family toxin [Acaryochloris sp. SU_5_25]NJM65071.1 type II toxin-antitoxin system HigB family toxin [Acaryochloris sp. RU_4_1]NJN38580.1 type II toxin-antitoxin system HigB family toxin [Acaryochloridaceae cyanobacterium CSU_3_4]NJR53892.1 type II toxin-antitoxin system HigB family toxin [Acaryochloris sp. CRU_2_0]